jgi:maleylacetate reductase
VTRLADEIGSLGTHRVMLIATGSANEAADGAARDLGDRVVARRNGVAGHVPAHDVEDAAVAAAGADSIVAMGGGSAIGLAKALAARMDLPIVAIPTTYSGSEMTATYGTTAAGHKKVMKDARVRPRVVIYDPELTLSLPRHVAGGSGMNAIAHCVEALWAPDANPVTSRWAQDGLAALIGGLRSGAERPHDIEARTRTLYGAFLAGLALSGTTMGLHHRVCHVLGGKFGVAHGGANAVMLPHVVAFNREAAADTCALVEKVLGNSDAVAGLRALSSELGAPGTLTDLGVDPGELDDVAARALADAVPNPRAVTESELMALLAAAA